MDEEPLYHRALAGSSRGAALQGLGELYAEIALAQRDFRGRLAAAELPVACPSGCGDCCTAFIPDLLPLEADYLAAWLLKTGHPAVFRLPEAGRACPFYAADRPGANCTVYPARPLICRLFGFSPVRGKDGLAEYKLCRLVQSPFAGEARSLGGTGLETAAGAPTTMDAFAARLLALAPDECGDRNLLPELLPRSVARVGLLLSLAAADPEDDGGDNDNPGGNRPSGGRRAA